MTEESTIEKVTKWRRFRNQTSRENNAVKRKKFRILDTKVRGNVRYSGCARLRGNVIGQGWIWAWIRQGQKWLSTNQRKVKRKAWLSIRFRLKPSNNSIKIQTKISL